MLISNNYLLNLIHYYNLVIACNMTHVVFIFKMYLSKNRVIR